MATEPAEAQTIDLEFREKIIARWEGLMRDAGASDYETGMDRAVQVFQFFVNQISLIRTKEDLRNMLAKLPDPSPVEKKIFLGFLNYLPQIIHYGAKQFAAKAERELPPIPRGRPSTVLQQKSEVVTYVGTLIMKGCSTEIGKKRAAAKFGMSESTVQPVLKRETSEQP
jgi:hypothetical protein